MTSQTDGSGYYGQAGVSSTNGPYNSIYFLVKQLLGWVRTCTIVQVSSVSGGGIGSPATVDVLPFVNMVDGILQVAQHDIVHGLPCYRMQGGGNAIICDPMVGDIGFVIVADRDISVIKSTKAQGAPGSRRQFDLADGIYFGGGLNATPTQYIAFTSTGITLSDMNANTIVMGPSGITINGVLFDQSQNVTNFTEATSKSGVTVTQHTHTQGNDSNGDIEVPTDMPMG